MLESCIFSRKKQHLCGECEEEDTVCNSWNDYLFTVISAVVLSAIGCFICLYWCERYILKEGTALDSLEPPNPIIIATAMHIKLCMCAYTFLSSIGILAHRICCHCPHQIKIALHGVCFLVILILTFIARGYAVMAAKFNKKRPGGGVTGYLPHAGPGLVIVIVLPIQFVCGLLMLNRKCRRLFLDIHKSLGLAIYAVTAFTVIGAISQEQMRPIGTSDQMVPMTFQHILFNIGAIILIFMYSLTIFILTHKQINAECVMVVPDCPR